MTRSIAAGALSALFTVAFAVPVNASATDDVRAALIRFAALNSCRLSVESGGTMDYVKPNSLHMTTRGTEMIFIGTTMYIKRPGKNWMKIENKGAVPMPVSDWTRMSKNDASTITATDLGMRVVGGESLHAYRVSSSKTGKTNTIYVARDGYLHRVDGDTPGHSVTFSKFNEIAPLRPPI